MEAPLDMNSNRILNLGAPVSGNDAVRLKDVLDLQAGGTIDLDGKANSDASNIIDHRPAWINVLGAALKDASNLTPGDVTNWATVLGLDPNNKGFWNAELNIPSLTTGVGVEGNYYTVSVAGSVSIDGNNEWKVGDTITFSDGAWQRIPFGQGGTTGTDITVEQFGAKAGDPTFDNTKAFNDAIEYTRVNKGSVIVKSGADYYFKDTIKGSHTGLVISGTHEARDTRLMYNGPSTTINLFEFGNFSAPEIRQVRMSGIQIVSLTKMTAGCAIYAPKVIEGVFDVDIQTQAWSEVYGNNIWNGFWLRHGATVIVKGQSWEGQNTGIIVNGAPGASGGKSDLFIDINKIAAWKLGVHQAGAFGGVYLSDHTTLIANFTHYREDQAHTAENNREFFASSCTFDFTSGPTLAPGSGGKSIMLMGPGDCLFEFRTCWIAGGVGSNFYIGPSSKARVIITGCRFFIGNPDPVDTTLKGDAITIDSPDCDVHVTGSNFRAFSGWAINQRTETANLYYSGCVMLGNTLGNVNPAIPIKPGVFSENGPARFYRVVESDTFRVQNGISQGTHFKMDNGMPVLAYEPQSFHRFNPSTKKIDWYLNNQTSLQIAPKGISLRSQPFLAYEYITGTLDSAGNAIIPNGTISPFTVLFGFVSVIDGAAPGRTAEVQVQSESGSLYVSMANAAHAGKSFRGIVFYLTGE